MKVEFEIDTTDFTRGQLNSIRYLGYKPVVDCDGAGIGTAKNKRGAALVTLRIGPGDWDEADLQEVIDATVEYDNCFVIGPRTKVTECMWKGGDI